MSIPPLPPERLYRRCDPQQFDFETTADLQTSRELIGQERAADAVRFGIGMRHKGYNLFVLGPTGMGRHALVRQQVEQRAVEEPVPPDWCYVFNFADMHSPSALRLPPGRGAQLRRDMEQLVGDLRDAISGVFESDEYRTRVQSMHEELEEQQEKSFTEIQGKAKEKDILLLRTPTGITLAPRHKGKPLDPDEFRKLSKEDRERIEADVNALQEELRKVMLKIPTWKKETDEKIEALNRELASAAISDLLEAVKRRYDSLDNVLGYLQRVEDDVIDNYRQFLPEQGRNQGIFGLRAQQSSDAPPWHHRYKVNVMLAHDDGGGAPVVHEDLPSYNNLLGRIEHRANLGALETDFTMIRSGALHRANGGYLVLDAMKLLMQPFAWEGLKRALQAGEIRMESLGQIMSLISTVTLEPQPIPLDVKVIVIGERPIYYLLAWLDPEFETLFKVAVDLEDRLEWSPESDVVYARLVASVAERARLHPFARDAVARMIEHGARLAQDNERLTGRLRSIEDLAQEADFWANEAGRDRVTAEDVQKAIDAQIGRADRIRRRVQEEIVRGTLLIDTDGEKIGQVNGLAVASVGGFLFGHPSRITARTRLGKGEVVDIEREVKLGGPIHSKGVLILSGVLAGRYALDYPLSLSASLVFEQSYGGVEGDSASAAELYALLSSLAALPIRQSFAVTGSINQLGEIQAIGGVNEKIEGFFDVCSARGLNGEQGVLIPASNTKHLMLRQDVVEAVEHGRFGVYAITSIDQGLEILTGTPAGERDADGRYPPDSVNGRVEARLIGFSERLRALRSESEETPGKGQGDSP